MEPVEFENILIKLMFDNTKARERVMPFLLPDIFDEPKNISIIKYLTSFSEEYNKFPTIPEMKMHIKVDDSSIYSRLLEIMKIDLSEYEESFLLKEVELFFREKLIMGCATDIASSVRDGKLENVSPMPDKLRDAMSFSFNTEIGLDLLSSGERMYKHFHNKDKVIPTGLPCFDKLIDGGFHEKSLSLFMAETNLGKSLIMASLAVNALLQNKNVLYITCEMSEDKISERMISNLFDIETESLKTISSQKFINKFESMKSIIGERLFIKEYPPRAISVSHIRNLLKELLNKKKFVPDIIYLDYLGIILPMNTSKGDNTYMEQKRVTEEVRALAVELKIPIVSAVQTNRCLDSKTKIIILENSQEIEKEINDICKGDFVKSDIGYNKVLEKYEEDNECYEIELKSGKKIICSSKHLFPTESGCKSIDIGLKEGDKLFSRSD